MSSANQVFIQDLPAHVIDAVAGRFEDPEQEVIEGYLDRDKWFSITRSEFDVFMENTGRRSNMKVPAGVGEKNRPQCPDHVVPMEYDPANAVWVCPNFQCDKKARKRLTIGDASGHVISGDLHLYSTGTGDEEQYFLYIRQLNVFIDVTSKVNRDSTGELHNSGGKFHLSMMFEKLFNKD